MLRYDIFARQRQHELLREAETARLQRLANEGRRIHSTRPELRWAGMLHRA
jgi:hypothetical protein